MQERKILAPDINVFIDFQIIKNSQPISLSKELDVLIASGKSIYIWSKTVSPKEMKQYCSKIIIPTPEEEKKLHQKVFILRHKDHKTYKEISDALNIPIGKVSYYTKTDPLKEWILDDWIVSYEIKDSQIYPKVDFLVDNDEKLVQRFKRAGRPANLITKV